MILKPLRQIKLSSVQLILLTSMIIACGFNLPFLLDAYRAINPQSGWQWLFFITVPLLLTCLTIIVLTLAGGLFFPRVVAGLTILISSLLLYATLSYGIIFDRSMIQNIIETNSGEAFSYLNSSFVIFFVLCGLFPVFAIFQQNLLDSLRHRVLGILKLNGVALLCVAVIAGVFYKDYAAVGRNNQTLTKYLIPFAFYDSGYKYLRDQYFYPPLPYRVLDQHPAFIADNSQSPETVVMVVGETARAENFSLNGYAKYTTPQLAAKEVVSFANVTSCGTATAVSVPCMFSRLNRAEYDSRLADSQDNVLDIIHRAGVEVTWIDNNSSCKGVCKRIPTIEYDPSRDPDLCDGDYCFDEILLPQLQQVLSDSSNKPRLIVLHMIGSHGPTYYRRYPNEYRIFTPDCPYSDIQNCTTEQLQNTYDNTIAYTDHVLAEVISILERVPNSAMLYLSDHGESLGEKGLYLHGFPYQIAPDEQTHVPMIYWDNALAQTEHHECIASLSDETLSQDNLFDILLGLTSVASSVYQPTQDILSSCRSTNLTMQPNNSTSPTSQPESNGS